MGSAVWTPQPGPQTAAATCPVDVVFYGGKRGGGKSDCLLGRQIRGVEKHGRNWNGLVIRKKYKDLGELRLRVDKLIADGLPAERIGGDNQANTVRFKDGGQFKLVAIPRPEFLEDYQGHQYTEISIDEAPNLPFIAKAMDKLKGSLRSAFGIPCRMFLTGNPGGAGAATIKSTFIDPALPGTVMYDQETGESSIFIESSLEDNPALALNDPLYVRRLQSIKDPALRAAWLDGNWDVFIGQAFDFVRKYHVIKPIPIPKWAHLYSTFDWGFGAPFSWGWWWVDGEGRVYRFAEWYGWDGKMPDTGIRLSDSKIAEGIVAREKKMGIWGRPIIRLSNPDCFNKKPDYKGGGQGPSTSEEFNKYGIYMSPGDPSRHLKLRQFRERLQVPSDDNGIPTGELPMMVVYENCSQFIRTIPYITTDEIDIEDVDTSCEDHVYDEAALICMARPIATKEPPGIMNQANAHIQSIERTVHDTYEEAAIRNQREEEIFWEHQANQEHYDGRTYSDIDGR
ncbi:MAG: hypothetical protein WC373_11770 [Smithella sp.]|jgi:hypothetical protein